MAQPGYFETTLMGAPVSIPLLGTLMTQWIAQVENEYIPGLVNEGSNSPSALGAACLQYAQAAIDTMQAFTPPIPDATMATALPYQSRIVFEAGFVLPSQWNTATYSANLPGTIAEAMTAAQTVVTPPPPTSRIRVGTCYGNICTPGPGSTLQNTADGQIVTNPDGSEYMAHVTSLVGMQQLWFSPVAKS